MKMVRLQIELNINNIFDFYTKNKQIDNATLRYLFPKLHELECYDTLKKKLICTAYAYDKNPTMERMVYVVTKLNTDTEFNLVLDDSNFYQKFGQFHLFGLVIKDEAYYDNFIKGKFSKMKYFPAIKHVIAKLVLNNDKKYREQIEKMISSKEEIKELDSIPDFKTNTIIG